MQTGEEAACSNVVGPAETRRKAFQKDVEIAHDIKLFRSYFQVLLNDRVLVEMQLACSSWSMHRRLFEARMQKYACSSNAD